MFLKGKISLRKNMAIFVCVALVLLLLPDVTHAESSSSTSLSLSAYAFYVANLTINIIVYDSANPDQEDSSRMITGNVNSKKKPKKDRD